MTEIRLFELKISNFKGIRSFHFAPMGQSFSIYGDNGTGKTSVYDALMWLLFDRDSRDCAQFDIKPLDGDGNVLSPGAATEVEAALSVGGEELLLKKTYYEKWTKKRGSADKTFDGNASDYFLDGVPVRKKDFESRIEKIIDRETFRLLTSVNYFGETLPWQKRREVLFDICDMPEDTAVMATDERFTDLLTAVGRGSVDDLKKKLALKRKGLNETRIKAPAKIETLEKSVGEYAAVDYKKIEDEIAALEEKRAKLEAKQTGLKNGGGAMRLRAELAEAKTELSELQKRNVEYREAQMRGAKPDDTDAGLSELFQKKAVLSAKLKTAREETQRLGAKVSALRTEYRAAADEEWRGETVCPACGREYDADSIGRAKAAFLAHKAEKLSDIAAKANKLKLEIADLEGLDVRLSEELKTLGAKIAALEKMKAAAPTREAEDMQGYAAEAARIKKEIERLGGEMLLSEKAEQKKTGELDAEITAVTAKIKAAERTLAGRDFIAQVGAQTDAIRKEARAAAREIEKTDRMICLCEEFVKYKVSFVTKAVNEKFALARFRLFNAQVNGGIADCCDVLYEGANFATNLNSGARICVGMDIINTLSEAFGVGVPLFIDNAESVTALPPMDTQVVRLVVSAEDKELRCEAWD